MENYANNSSNFLRSFLYTVLIFFCFVNLQFQKITEEQSAKIQKTERALQVAEVCYLIHPKTSKGLYD